MSLNVHTYEGWSITNEKNRDANDCGQIHFTVFQYYLLQAQQTSPIDMLEAYTIHEELFVLQFEPAIYNMDDLFITAKSLSMKRIFQRSEHEAVRRSQIWWIRWVTEQFLATFSNCDHGNGRRVGRCIVVMKQHTVTQLSVSFLLDGRPKFLDQFSIVDTSNSLPSLQLVSHQDTLTTIPEYWPTTLPAEAILRNLTGISELTCFHCLLCCLVTGSKWWAQVSSIHGDISAEKLRWICIILTKIVTWSGQTDLLVFPCQHSDHPSSTHLVVTQHISNNTMCCTIW